MWLAHIPYLVVCRLKKYIKTKTKKPKALTLRDKKNKPQKFPTQHKSWWGGDCWPMRWRGLRIRRFCLLSFSWLSCRAKEKGEGRRRWLYPTRKTAQGRQSWAVWDRQGSFNPILCLFNTTHVHRMPGLRRWCRWGPRWMGQSSCLYGVSPL